MDCSVKDYELGYALLMPILTVLQNQPGTQFFTILGRWSGQRSKIDISKSHHDHFFRHFVFLNSGPDKTVLSKHFTIKTVGLSCCIIL